jgi:hypothetical protein
MLVGTPSGSTSTKDGEMNVVGGEQEDEGDEVCYCRQGCSTPLPLTALADPPSLRILRSPAVLRWV